MTAMTIMPTNVVEPAAFDAEGAAVYTGLTVNALAIRRYRGLGPRYRKKRGRVLYLRDDLNAWLAAEDEDG